MTTWTREKPRAPFAWRVVIEATGETHSVGASQGDTYSPEIPRTPCVIEFCALPEIKPRETAREEMERCLLDYTRLCSNREVLLPKLARLLDACDRILREGVVQKVDVERLWRAVVSCYQTGNGVCGRLSMNDARSIATAYDRDGAT